MRAESAVDPTRSENITVTWRALGGVLGLAPSAKIAEVPGLNRQMPEQDAYLLQVLIGSQDFACCWRATRERVRNARGLFFVTTHVRNWSNSALLDDRPGPTTMTWSTHLEIMP
jgi:hypothetical protein